MKQVIIDATNKPLGRLASEIAIILMGKNKVEYVPYKITGDKVKVVNVNDLKLTGNKESQIIYKRYTGYPSGIREKKIKDITRKEALEKTLYNMLPKNKLRKELLKRLIIE